jgi:rhodanese-related sulfurtransferase
MKTQHTFFMVPLAFSTLVLVFGFAGCANNAAPAKGQASVQSAGSETGQTAGETQKSPRLIKYEEFANVLADPSVDALVVDVRTREEFNAGHIPGAILFPYDEIDTKKDAFARLAGRNDRPIVLYCRSGNRSSIAARSLDKLGYTDIADFGGLGNWKGNIDLSPAP